MVLIGIVLLVFATPLTVEADEPWHFAAMEVVIFLLVACWMVKALLGCAMTSQRDLMLKRELALPSALFIGVIIIQLIPVPPTWLRTFSPATYELYAKSLSGWPQKIPYDELLSPAPLGRRTAAPSDDAQAARMHDGRYAPHIGVDVRISRKGAPWRAISIAPEVTGRALLKCIAYGCMFFLVAFYQFDLRGKRFDAKSLCRWIIFAALMTGLFIGVAGLLRRSADDYQSFWLFLPHDDYDPSSLRASGPFENPDHFANYLDLILPFAIAGILFPKSLISEKYKFAFRWFCGFVALVLVAGLTSSASRAGWIGAAISTTTLLWLSANIPAPYQPRLLRLKGYYRLILPGFAAGALVLTLVVAGPAARTQADTRLSASSARDDFAARLEPAADSLGMIRDFPLLSVGLGCWAELFPRYRRAPWSSTCWAETHNDYVQLMAEAGLLGFVCLALVFLRLGKSLYVRRPPPESSVYPIFAALVSAILATAFHEGLDFPRHISANALLFAIWLGLAVRIVTSGDESARSLRPLTSATKWLYAGIGAAAIASAFIATAQEAEPYFP
jgi:hypothetical protein